MFYCEKCSANIDAVDVFPGFERHFPDVGVGLLVGDSGIGAQDVDGAEVGCGLLDCLGDGGFVGDVALGVEDVGA